MQGRGETDVELSHRVDHRKPSVHGSLRIVLVSLGVAEIGEHAIARKGCDHPAERSHNVRAPSVVIRKYNTQIFWIEPRRQGRRFAETARQHGKLPTLGRWRLRTRLPLHGRA
jgi:hypothetical protein